ncbi:MAG: GntR family transcriptional regulator [Propionibacteriales bacterium]|nr:GntR family transcriptional regulator [Propionibacteriales bacterium]
MQIKTQLEYLIATGGVPEGTQIPSVRQLSSRLGVAIDTVRQAYDDLTRAHLVTTRRGRGTFTRLPDSSSTGDFSHRRLWIEADRAAVAYLTGGVNPGARAKAMANRLHMLDHGMRVAFVGVEVSVERYAGQVSDVLPARTPVTPLAIEQVRADPSTLWGFSHVVALVFHSTELEERAPGHCRVLPLMSGLAPRVLDEISQLPQGPVALVARASTSPLYLDLVRARRDDLTLIEVADDSVESLTELDLVAVLHTSATRREVQRHADKRGLPMIELAHRPQDRSLQDVAGTLRSDTESLLELQRTITAALPSAATTSRS